MGVIRFPTERRLQAAARAGNEAAAAAQTAPAAEPLAAGQAFAFMSMEIRRLPTTTSRIDGEIAARILNRCVLAALEILSKEKIPVDLAGTVLRPVIEATFPGHDGAARAARAGLAIRQSVTKVQREVELEFHVFGAITVGTVTQAENGVTLTSGAPEQVAARIREHAAPGQFLLSEPAREACRDAVEVGAPMAVTIPGSNPVSAYAVTDAQ